MATIQAGGARRSAAPTYTRTAPSMASAEIADPELLRRMAFEEQAVASPMQQGSLAEAFARGVSTLSGQGANASFGQSPNVGSGNTGGGGFSPASAQALGTGMSALGAIAGNSGLSQIGSMIGLGGATSAANTPGQALATMAGPAVSALGVPGAVIGFGTNAVQGNVPGMVNSALSLANPAIAALNALSGVLGFGTLGSAVANGIQNTSLGFQINPEQGIVSAAQQGYSINNSDDPMGALIGALNTGAYGYGNDGDGGDNMGGDGGIGSAGDAGMGGGVGA